MSLTDEQKQDIARRWVDVINTGDVEALDELVAYDVVDHSGLVEAHGTGCDGYKQLVRKLRESFPDYSSRLDSTEVDGDLVTVRHTGSATYPSTVAPLMGAAAGDPSMQRMEFAVTSAIRLNDEGKIVEHWAVEGPFGAKYPPPGGPGTGSPPSTGTPELNKQFMRAFVRNVIDAMSPSAARYYFTENFRNHDPAPGEEPGMEGAIRFLESIYAAFSEFHTTLDDQFADDDLVVGRWSQTFRNTGPYLNFPASGKQINIGGITITRVRDSRILEQWEARDALSLLNQMGIPSPLGPLEGGPTADEDEERKEIVRRFFYDVWGQGHVSEVDQIFAPDFVNHSRIPGQREGVAGVTQLVQATRTGFPDWTVSVDLQIAAGDRVATRYTLRGTHQGTFRGVPATGRPVEITGISIHAVRSGKLTDHWGLLDDTTLVLQLGLLEFPDGGYQPPDGGGSGYEPPESEAESPGPW